MDINALPLLNNKLKDVRQYFRRSATTFLTGVNPLSPQTTRVITASSGEPSTVVKTVVVTPIATRPLGTELAPSTLVVTCTVPYDPTSSPESPVESLSLPSMGTTDTLSVTRSWSPSIPTSTPGAHHEPLIHSQKTGIIVGVVFGGLIFIACGVVWFLIWRKSREALPGRFDTSDDPPELVSVENPGRELTASMDALMLLKSAPNSSVIRGVTELENTEFLPELEAREKIHELEGVITRGHP
jgi:hypothetical protein